jgi:putative FmdB family regulatory protein
MPIYEYQCQGCGFIIEEYNRVLTRDVVPDEVCPIDRNEDWQRVVSLPAKSLGVKFQNEGYPYLSHCRDFVREVDGTVAQDKNGQPRYERVVFESEGQQKQFMDKHDLVQYETPVDEQKVPVMPDHVKAMESHPTIRKYLDQKKANRIPDHLLLTEDELHQNFDL